MTISVKIIHPDIFLVVVNVFIVTRVEQKCNLIISCCSSIVSTTFCLQNIVFIVIPHI
jgi:hypothetical protein